MEMNEYRLHAAECLCIADEITEPKNKMLLIAMAQYWLKLAQQAEEGTQAAAYVESPQASKLSGLTTKQPQEGVAWTRGCFASTDGARGVLKPSAGKR
jgi:hypothetical protein